MVNNFQYICHLMNAAIKAEPQKSSTRRILLFLPPNHSRYYYPADFFRSILSYTGFFCISHPVPGHFLCSRYCIVTESCTKAHIFAFRKKIHLAIRCNRSICRNVFQCTHASAAGIAQPFDCGKTVGASPLHQQPLADHRISKSIRERHHIKTCYKTQDIDG